MPKRLFSDPRYHQLVEALLKASSGTFSYRLPISGKKDEIDTLSLLFNHASLYLAKMFRDLQTKSYQFIQPRLLIQIDHKHMIEGYIGNEDFLSKPDIESSHLPQYLSKSSRKKYKRCFKGVPKSTNQGFDFGILDFKSPAGLLLPLKVQVCKLNMWNQKNRYIITGYNPEEDIPEVNINSKHSIHSKALVSPLALKVMESDSKNIYDYQLAQKLHRIIMDGLHHTIPSLPDIAFKAGASLSRIKRVFKEHYGKSILQYDMQKRLEGSLVILEGGGMSIKQIGNHFGFKTAAHFTQRFKRHFEVTPSQYRKDYFSGRN